MFYRCCNHSLLKYTPLPKVVNMMSLFTHYSHYSPFHVFCTLNNDMFSLVYQKLGPIIYGVMPPLPWILSGSILFNVCISCIYVLHFVPLIFVNIYGNKHFFIVIVILGTVNQLQCFAFLWWQHRRSNTNSHLQIIQLDFTMVLLISTTMSGSSKIQINSQSDQTTHMVSHHAMNANDTPVL